jgi:hypothetical protein
VKHGFGQSVSAKLPMTAAVDLFSLATYGDKTEI